MPNTGFDGRCRSLISDLTTSGQLKPFHTLTSPMGPVVNLEGKGEVVVLCSNNYLGLADDPEVIAAGQEGLRRYGAGTGSVRFICGTFACHRELEQTIARFVGTESALSYVSCWNANEALFPTLTQPGDCVFSDALNHASIIDSLRLMAKGVDKVVYKHSQLDELEAGLKSTPVSGVRWVVTDGVFSMEGDVARLAELVELCRRYEAILVVDDSHGVGVLGKSGKGTPEHAGLLGQIDILTGTLGKSLGGAAGGYVAGKKHVIEVLEQRSRPSLFSNAVPPTVACSARKAIEVLERDPSRVARLHANVRTMREGFAKLGFHCPDSPTAIIPIMIGDAADAIAKSKRLLELGVLVIGFAFPVVPKGEARLRVQVSAALSPQHLQRALDAFAKL